MIEAVVIDFDDTLCLTEEACFRLENETLRQMGRAPMLREVHKATWGQPLYDAISVRSPGIDADAFWKLMPTIHEQFIRDGQIDVVPEANLETMDALAQAGKKLMILTSRSIVEVEHLIEPSHHLFRRLVAFYHKDNTSHHKPDPRVFDVIERDHGLTPGQCVYVGDSPSDAAAAKGAGLHFIASLESGLRTEKDFQEYSVDRFIPHFTHLADAVSSIDASQL